MSYCLLLIAVPSTEESRVLPYTLTVLGAGTPYPRPDEACSGYLLDADGTTIWVDAGPGSFANLQRHTAPDRLSAIWLSHLHADHTADLLSAFYALSYADLSPAAPIPVYGPAGWARRLAGFLGRRDPGFLSDVFDLRQVSDGHEVSVGPVLLSTHEVRHGVPAYGLRAEYDGAVFAYSGDTGPCPELVGLAADADLFLCEADGGATDEDDDEAHCSPEDAGAAAKEAGVGTLLVTHVARPLTAAEATRRAAAAFGGKTLTAREGDTHPIA